MSKRIQCLVVDDEPLAIELLENHIAQVPQLALVKSCQHALEAFEVLKQEDIDLIFLDIQMPVLTGIEFVRSLPSPPKIIFTTAYREYAVESYELDVVDYLLKPITFTRFFKAINKYLDQKTDLFMTPAESTPVETPLSGHMFVNVNKKHVKVMFKDILYIESLKDYVKIYLAGDKAVVTKEKMSVLEETLPDPFLRTHRSYLVNTIHVTAYTAHDIEIGVKEIPIGISYKRQVQERLK